jgi:hypothetical protein
MYAACGSVLCGPDWHQGLWCYRAERRAYSYRPASLAPCVAYSIIKRVRVPFSISGALLYYSYML